MNSTGFVETCAAIAGSDARDVAAVDSCHFLRDDLVVRLRFADDSLATISYSRGGHGGTEKERIEVLGPGGSRSVTIVDFAKVRPGWPPGANWRAATRATGPKRQLSWRRLGRRCQRSGIASIRITLRVPPA